MSGTYPKSLTRTRLKCDTLPQRQPVWQMRTRAPGGASPTDGPEPATKPGECCISAGSIKRTLDGDGTGRVDHQRLRFLRISPTEPHCAPRASSTGVAKMLSRARSRIRSGIDGHRPLISPRAASRPRSAWAPGRRGGQQAWSL